MSLDLPPELVVIDCMYDIGKDVPGQLFVSVSPTIIFTDLTQGLRC